METSTSRSSERKARTLAIGAAALLLAVPAAAIADESKDATQTVQQAPHLTAPSVGVPYTGIVLQGGKDDQRLTAALTYTVAPQFTLDVKVSGANVSQKTQRSLLFDAQGVAPGAQVSVGVTWSNYRTRRLLAGMTEALCAEQNAANGYATGPDEEALLNKKVNDDPGYKKALEAKEAIEKEQKALGDPARLRKDADKLWADLEAARAEALKAQQEADKLFQEAATKDRAAATGPLRAALDRARLTVDRVALQQVEAALAQEKIARAARLADEVSRAKDDLAKEKARVAKSVPAYCYARSQLTPDRRSRIPSPSDVTWIATLRGTFGAQSTDYLDTATAKKETDTVYPMSVAMAVGAYLTQTSLLAVRLDYGRVRQSNEPSSVCQDLPIDSKTTSPPTYNCTSIVVGQPTWATRTAIRGEYRQFIAAGVGFNPSFTWAWSGAESGLFAAKKGSWSLDLPIYMRFVPGDSASKKAAESDKADPPSVSVGVALSHKQTWGLGDKDEATNDASVFLGGAFDLKL
jgi:hypothetical protein